MEKEREIERRYLAKFIPHPIFKFSLIEQGYLSFGDNSYLRVRREEHSDTSICLKFFKSAFERYEFNQKISQSTYEELIKRSMYKVRKYRGYTPFSTTTYPSIRNIAIDIFSPKLAIVEIEFNFPSTNEDLPSYCGKEVTEDERYSNVSLAKSGLFWDSDAATVIQQEAYVKKLQ